MKKLSLLLAGALAFSACGLTEKIREQIVVYVSGAVAAQLQAEASVAVQERMLESLTGMNAEYQGDGKWVVIPLADQPTLGEDATAPTEVNIGGGALAPRYFTQATAVSQTGYVAASEAGPDGTTGWYKRDYNGFVFYYKTQPAADLSQRWPENVQVLWSGWRGAANTYARGYTWWMKSEVLSATRVRGEWAFEIGGDAEKYQGTRYHGAYDYERVPDERVNVTVSGDMKWVNGSDTRESYTDYAYTFTNATNVEAGRFFFGVGPAVKLNDRPAWTAGKNPAGDDWTNATQRPGLYLYKVWVDAAVSWWKYDGTSQVCSTEPAYVLARGGGAVTAGKTLQLSAEAYNACNDRLKYRAVSWTSGNEAVATVSRDGLVSALAPGQAEMTARAGDAAATVAVSVRELDVKPAKVVISGGASVQAGATLKLAATVYNKNNEVLENVAVAWTSLGTAVATVSAQGVVSGVADGTTTIRATAGEVTGDQSMRVYDPAAVSSVSISCPSNRTIVGAAAVNCDATGYNYAGAGLTGTVFTWTSSNTAVLTVDSTGNVTPVAKGTAVVTASANGKQQQITFVVYNQNDVSYVVVASANGSNLRVGDSAFKLALTARAYNYLGDEIPNVSFTWSSDNPTMAQPTAGSPNNTAEVSSGATEGNTTIRATTPTSVVGTFTVGNWDNRVSTIQIVNGALSSVSSISMALGANYQLYVRAYNANNRLLGYVTPAWTVPNGLAIDANGKLTAGNAEASGLVVTATVPKGDGSGDATDTLTVGVYDALKPVSLTSSCTSTYNKYAGQTQSCNVWAYNSAGGAIAGMPVTWYVSDPAKLTITSQNNTGSPGTVQFQVPPALATGGSVTFKAYTACAGAAVAPNFTGCVVSGQGTVTARGTQDINYVTITSPASGTKIGTGSSTTLVAKAYDYQGTPQEMAGVSFTFTRQSGTSFNAPNASGVVTAATTGLTYFLATANGSVSSSSFGYYLEGVNPAQATVVSLTSAPASIPNLRPFQTFTIWATATNALGQTIPGATFTWSTNNTRLQVMSSTATTATVRFIRCDCANSATNTASVTATYTGVGGAQASRTVTVVNPVYNVTVNTAAYTLVPVSVPFNVSVTVTGYDSQPAPIASTVVLQENGTQAAYDVSGLSLVNMVYQDGNALTVNVYAEDASTASSRTVQWYFYLDPVPVDMGAAATGTPALSNGYLAKELYYFPTAGDFAKALTYATWATTGVDPERTYTSYSYHLLDAYSFPNYGTRKLATGEIVLSRIGVRMTGYVQFSGATQYVRSQAWERVRVKLGGQTILNEWSTTGAQSLRTVKLTGLPTFTWIPIEIEGLMDAAQTGSNARLGWIRWSTNGTTFSDTPGTALAQDP